jgi:hypothetical protein
VSKGSPIKPIRICEELLRRIADQIHMTEIHSFGDYRTLSEWIRQACEEKLAKMIRSRRGRRRRDTLDHLVDDQVELLAPVLPSDGLLWGVELEDGTRIAGTTQQLDEMIKEKENQQKQRGELD